MIFQKDYWKMDDRDLEQLVTKYDILASENRSQEGVNWLVIDRNRIIATLISRDTALRTSYFYVTRLIRPIYCLNDQALS